MPRPKLLRRQPDIWADPSGRGEDHPEPPYSAFTMFITRVSAALLASSLLTLVIGYTRDSEQMMWASMALAVPAFLYLSLVYALAWSRAALEEMTYGDLEAGKDDPVDPAVAVAKTRFGRRRTARRAARRERKTNDAALLWRLAKECRRYWIHMVVLLLVSLAATPIFLLSPMPLAIAIDSVLKNGPLPSLLRDHLPAFFTSSHTWLLLVAVLLQVIVALLSQIQSLATNVLSTYTGEKMSLDLRARMFGHLQRVSLSFHDTKGASDSAYRVQYDAPAIQAIVIGGFIPLFSSAFTLITAVVVAISIDWQLTLVALAVAPLLFMSSQRFKNQMRPHYTGVKALESNALGVVQEVLTSLRVVKAFGREDAEQQRYVAVSERGLQAKVRLAFAESIFGMVAAITVSIGAGAVLFVGVRHVQTGVITLGQLLLVTGYTAQLFKPLRTFTKQVGKLQFSLASAERAFEILDEEPEVVDSPQALPLGHAIGEIEFSDVAFSYDDGQPVLEGVSFHIDPGSTVGIAGRTGAGKSTLLSLMMRFYEPDSGVVKLEGRDLRDYKVADVRSQFALVLQDPVLFSTTIADNIRYGRPDAGIDEVVAAAKAANAHSFISSMPDGYDSLVGERGMKLSGGERQRVSLARAFLKNASVLILDEPTSSVDVQTEAEIMEAMERLMEGRTTLMIAHRLQTLQNCDMILLVDRGRVRVAEPDLLADLMAEIALEVRAEPELKPRVS